MGQLIILDASVAIAALAVGDVHHKAASAALAATIEDELVIAATTRAEILVGPARVGGPAFATARDFVDGCATVPVTASIADFAAALKARHRALSLPDAISLAVADLIDADAVWTFDRRWSGIDSRVTIPGAGPRPSPEIARRAPRTNQVRRLHGNEAVAVRDLVAAPRER